MENPVGSSSALRRRRRIQRKTEPTLPNESSLPDDIIADILSRLPAKDVFRSRCVFKRWRDLTSTRDFTDLHRRRNFPMLLKSCIKGRTLLDRCWEPSQTRSKIQKVYEPCQIGPHFSHNGLLVATGTDFKIYNPIYRDAVNINLSHGTFGTVYGVFFHPIQQEYCTLWRIIVPFGPWRVQYRILNLESDPQWRVIKNPCNPMDRIKCIPPVLLEECLYWMVVALEPNPQMLSFNCYTVNCNIIEYNIRNEEFRMIPCPVPVTVKDNKYNVNLVDIDGVVSVVQVIPSLKLVEINIWTLKNQGEQLWTSSHYMIPCDLYRGYGVPKAIAFWNGELVIQSLGRLYVCNLKLATFRKFGKNYTHDVKFFSHLTSLASLRNCKSEICMLEEDENNPRDEIQALP